MVGSVNVTVHSSSGAESPVEVLVFDSGSAQHVLASQNGTSDGAFQFKVSSPKLWSPDSPTLYNVTVRLGEDEVSSYTGFRTISKGKVDGITRPLLNGEFIFQFGTLDQGFWPDGLYTPPNREAMVYDLQVLKKLGFNMLRKHVSVHNYKQEGSANVSSAKRSKLRPRYSIKLVTKWASCSSKTCQHCDRFRAIRQKIALPSRIYQMQINKRSSIGNSKFSLVNIKAILASGHG
jgi:hypothetical protein